MSFVEVARALTPHGWSGPARVHIQSGVIDAIEPLAHSGSLASLVPGFVDLQVNGIDDIDVTRANGSDWERLDQLLLDQGVTTWCPTLITMALDRYERPLASIGAAMARPAAGRPAIAGAHLEGPFLGRSPGAHPPELIAPVDLGWLQALPDHVALVTLGPEQPDAIAATRLLTTKGCRVAAGHTQCSESEFDACVQAGATLTTHLYNGMSGVHHRSPGVAVFALTNSHVSASLIADGVHVHPRALLLAAQALGPNRMVLVTDAVAWRAGHVGSIGLELREGAPRLPDGTLAGSSVTMIEAVRNCIRAGVPAEQALRAAATNPAALMGLSDRGTIEVGKRADMVQLTTDLTIEQVWVGGDETR